MCTPPAASDNVICNLKGNTELKYGCNMARVPCNYVKCTIHEPENE